MLDLLLLWR